MENSKIEWTDDTFSPWRGCEKVSPGCDNCYAEGLSHRNPRTLGEWGPGSSRAIAAENAWRRFRWVDKAAGDRGVRRRVFFSLGDPFEDRKDLQEHRIRFFVLMQACRNLDWLLLTKRPQNIMRLLPINSVPIFEGDKLAKNIWMGVSIENDDYIQRGYELLNVPAHVRFISAEPLLGPLTKLRELLMAGTDPGQCSCGHGHGFTRCPNYGGVAPTCHKCDCTTFRRVNGIHWVIVGGESGKNARIMDPDWARQIRDVCVECGVRFFFKQWGTWCPEGNVLEPTPDPKISRTRFPLPVRFPVETLPSGVTMAKVGKTPAGRTLDGRNWEEIPEGVSDAAEGL